MKKFEKVVFTANKNTVTANKYVAHALYVQNEALVEKLGGQVIKGAGLFTAQFKTTAKAKEFVANAVCSMDTKTYNASRKSEPKKVVVGKCKAQPTKSKKMLTLTDEDGNVYEIPVSALALKETKKSVKVAPTKGKGKKTATKKTSTPAPKKGKGNNKDFFGKLVGKGSACNRDAAKMIYAAGYKSLASGKGAELWAHWCEVR